MQDYIVSITPRIRSYYANGAWDERGLAYLFDISMAAVKRVLTAEDRRAHKRNEKAKRTPREMQDHIVNMTPTIRRIYAKGVGGATATETMAFLYRMSVDEVESVLTPEDREARRKAQESA